MTADRIGAESAEHALELLRWCADHNCRVKFASSGVVSVMLNESTLKRPTLREAVEAHRAKLARLTRG
jgi:hypothetical protein